MGFIRKLWDKLLGRLPDDSPCVAFDQVLSEEIALLRGSPCAAPAASTNAPPPSSAQRATEASLTALAFSGGGTRSGSYALGVAQALAEHGLLTKFDYLSTVSGGGFTGGWLAAQIREERNQAEGDSNATERVAARIANKTKEDDAVRFVRDWSSSVFPSFKTLNLDISSFVSTFVRNLLLNLITILLVLFLAMAVVQALVWGGVGMWSLQPNPLWSIAGAVVGIGLLALVSGRALNAARGSGACWPLSKVDAQNTHYYVMVLPLTMLVCNALVCLALWTAADTTVGLGTTQIAVAVTVFGYILIVDPRLFCVVFMLLASTVAAIFALTGSGHTWAEATTYGLALFVLIPLTIYFARSAVAGVQGSSPVRLGALVASSLLLAAMLTSTVPLLENSYQLGNPWMLVWLGTPLIVIQCLIAQTVWIGLRGRSLSAEEHAWWSRMGGGFNLAILAWLVFFGLAINGPSVFEALISTHVALPSWLAGTVGGVFAARAGTAQSAIAERLRRLLAQSAPYIFMIGLLLGASWLFREWFVQLYGVSKSMGIPDAISRFSVWCCGALSDHGGRLTNSDALIWYSFFPLSTNFAWPNPWAIEGIWPTQWGDYLLMSLAIAAALALALLYLGSQLKVNLFSLHHAYQERITRCYLRVRSAHRRKIGFFADMAGDDLPMAQLDHRPYPIINAALNVEDLSGQIGAGRKAVSFVFTPNYCGYAAGPGARGEAFRRTSAYAAADEPGGISLGRAMAVSCAAASPKMGFYGSRATAFLLAVANFRLGAWVGNPCGRAWHRRDPKPNLFYLLQEVTGSSSLDSDFVYLSDGGHFENLAIYELIRRRCRVIVVTDAGADPRWEFADLANAIRRCYVDFNVEIEIDVAPLRAGPNGRAQRQFAIGKIHYDPDNKNATPGILVYLKPVLTDSEPAEIDSYARINPKFPQDPTSDQWFDEAQFESYRKLGYLSASAWVKHHPNIVKVLCAEAI